MSVTPTKEQVAALVLLIPSLAEMMQSTAEDEGDCNEDLNAEPDYTISEMFTKKKKNARCTPAQNFLLVSTTPIVFKLAR